MSWYEYSGAVQGGGFGPDDDERRRRRRHARDSVAYTGGMDKQPPPRWLPTPSPGWGSRAPAAGEAMPAAEATAVRLAGHSSDAARRHGGQRMSRPLVRNAVSLSARMHCCEIATINS